MGSFIVWKLHLILNFILMRFHGIFYSISLKSHIFKHGIEILEIKTPKCMQFNWIASTNFFIDFSMVKCLVKSFDKSLSLQIRLGEKNVHRICKLYILLLKFLKNLFMSYI